MKITVFELVIMALTAFLILAMLYKIPQDNQKKAEFMSYCSSKGLSDEDCRFEWKRIKNGQDSSMIIFPMVIGK